MMTMPDKLATMELLIIALIAERDYLRSRVSAQKDALGVTSDVLLDIDSKTDSILARLESTTESYGKCTCRFSEEVSE